MIKILESSLLSSKIHLVAEKIWKVSLFGPDNYKSAVISHYLRSKDKSLKKPAIQFAEELLEGYFQEPITSKVAEDALQILLGFNEDIPFPKPAHPKFTFIDLFAGIGGFRIAMQKEQGECVFSSEW